MSNLSNESESLLFPTGAIVVIIQKGNRDNFIGHIVSSDSSLHKYHLSFAKFHFGLNFKVNLVSVNPNEITLVCERYS